MQWVLTPPRPCNEAQAVHCSGGVSYQGPVVGPTPRNGAVRLSHAEWPRMVQYGSRMPPAWHSVLCLRHTDGFDWDCVPPEILLQNGVMAGHRALPAFASLLSIGPHALLRLSIQQTTRAASSRQRTSLWTDGLISTRNMNLQATLIDLCRSGFAVSYHWRVCAELRKRKAMGTG